VKYNLILASGSPRRKEFLSWLGVPFEVLSADCDESSDKVDHHQRAMDIGSKKACATWEKLSSRLEQESFNPFVIAGDTIVCLRDKVFGKPETIGEAREFLLELSGKTHQVISSVCFKTKTREHCFSVCTEVSFANIPSISLENYLKSNDSLDKAGGYGIQGMAQTFISSIEGSYSNVVGFPLYETERALADFLKEGEQWRDCFIV
jgi:septum formation protein